MVSIARAMPKSVSFTRPSSRTRMLAGFTSRWTTPASWAVPSASAAWPRIDRTGLGLHRTLLADDRRQGQPLDDLHHQVGEVVVLAVVEDGGDVGVQEGSGVEGLVAEPLREDLLVVGVGAHDLDRDVAL